jgi:uncharacterized protein
MNLLVKQIRKKILPILRQHGIKKAGLFGSIVRDELKEESDIDILIEIKKDISLLDFIGIKLELEDVLGKNIDLVEYDTIKPRLKDRILKEQVRIL